MLRKLIAMVALLAPLAACSEGGSARKTASSQKEEDEDEGGSSKSKAKPIELAALKRGPYSLEPFGEHSRSYLLEAGFIDIERTTDDGPLGLEAVRWTYAAATAGTKLLPSGSKPGIGSAGCTEVSSLTLTSAGLDEVRFEGLVDGSVTDPQDAIYRLEDVKGDDSFDEGKQATAAFVEDDEEMARLTAPERGKVASVQLVGPIVHVISNALKVADVNARLEESDAPLTLLDTMTAVDYDLAVVTFYGGAKASTRELRCLIAPGGAVELSAKTYKKLLPIKGIFVWGARLKAEVQNGAGHWASTIAGQGIEDLRIP